MGKLFTVGAVLMLVGRQTFVSQSDRFAEEL
jgi:hypothetical protein